jgi:hypothetical protein
MKALFLPLFLGMSMTLSAQQPIQAIRQIMEISYINSNEALGTGMLGLGDINGDGKPDFAVSALNIERTFIYFGGKGVLDSLPDVVLLGGGQIGKGDLNGDGRMDLIVATPESLLVYLGKPTSPSSALAIDTVPGLVITGEGILDFNRNPFAVGDLNHDGYDDLVVANRDYGKIEGKIYVYSGKPHLISVPDFWGVGDTVGSQYAYRTEIADINGDGIPDLVVSTNDLRGFETVDIYYGHTGWTYSKNGFDQRLDSREGNWNTLSSVSLVDVNADHKCDIGFGYGHNMYFFYGRSDTVLHTPDLVLALPDANILGAYQGYAVNIGDINGDGKDDFALATTPGVGSCLLVYLGAPTPQPVAARCITFANISGSVIAALGDVNGNGINNFGFTAPYNVLGVPPQDGYFAILSGDTTLVTSAREIPPSARHVQLLQNYPNPFNPQTTIQYTLSKASHVLLEIYDSSGRQVRMLVDTKQDAGLHSVLWDGRSSGGGAVASGVYFYTLIVDGSAIEARKALLLK